MVPDNFFISNWPAPVKRFALAFLFLLTSGVTTGLIYLYTTTSWSAGQTVEYYRGSAPNDGEIADIPDNYPKPFGEMLLTTHNHWIGFSFIFFLIGGLFSFNTLITGKWKYFLMIEPFLSSWLTFASIWAMRVLQDGFIYLTIISAMVTYVSFYLMVFILCIDLLRPGK